MADLDTRTDTVIRSITSSITSTSPLLHTAYGTNVLSFPCHFKGNNYAANAI